MLFTDPLARGTGNISLLKADGEVVETFNAAISTALGLSGNTLTVDRFWDLDGLSDYYLTIDSFSLTDTSSNPFAGVNSATTLALRTGIETAGALGAAWLRDVFPGTSSEAIGNHSALFIRAGRDLEANRHFRGSCSEFQVGPDSASEAKTTSVPTYSLSATSDTDSGLAASINASGCTRDNTLGLSGTAKPGAKVRVYAGMTFSGHGTVVSDGTWSLMTRPLAEIFGQRLLFLRPLDTCVSGRYRQQRVKYSANVLRATKSLNAATRNSYSVRVQFTDQWGRASIHSRSRLWPRLAPGRLAVRVRAKANRHGRRSSRFERAMRTSPTGKNKRCGIDSFTANAIQLALSPCSSEAYDC